MKALKSILAQKILKSSFYDKNLAFKIRNGLPFSFEGKTYIVKKYNQNKG